MNYLPSFFYQAGNSPLHRLNAAVKLLCFGLLLTALMILRSFPAYITASAFLAAIMALGRLRLRSALQPVWQLRWFFLLVLLMNFCFYAPQEAFASWWIFSPSAAGLLQGLHIILRVTLILLLSSILIMTTAPVALTDGLQILLQPLRLLRIPAGQVSMILSVSLQFIPTLLEEANMIRKAQTARGAQFESPHLWEKARAAAPLVIPIFLAAFKRADELALAMEARGYHNQNFIPSCRPFPLQADNIAALLLCICLLFLSLFLR